MISPAPRVAPETSWVDCALINISDQVTSARRPVLLARRPRAKEAVRRRYRKMSLLPRVTEKARELVAREFDERGPDACMREIIEHLKRYNPELLDMAAHSAGDLRNSAKAMLAFVTFYRVLHLGPA